jgi:hypothetical protein
MLCPSHRMYRASGVIDTACIVHPVSMTPHSPCIRCQWHRMHHASCVIDTACIVHPVSMTPHAQCIRCHWHRMHRACGWQWHRMPLKKFEFLREFEFIFEKALFSPLTRGAKDGCFNEKKSRVENLVILSLLVNGGRLPISFYVHVGVSTLNPTLNTK